MAIDIGSNAMRAVYGIYDNQGDLEILDTFRFPLRLGSDVFKNNKISTEKLRKAHLAFESLDRIIKQKKISHIKAMGTSALRNAKNKSVFIDSIQKKFNIKIQIISGNREAKLIAMALSSHFPIQNQVTLMIDIGGGSTEVTVSKNHKILYSKSFPLGTLRLLRFDSIEKVEATIHKFTHSVSSDLKKLKLISKINFVVGTGGNLRRMGKLRKTFFKRSHLKIFQHELSAILQELSLLTPKQRVQRYSMGADRADVIIPAMTLIEDLMLNLNISAIHLPSVGLKEGILLNMLKTKPRNILNA